MMMAMMVWPDCNDDRRDVDDDAEEYSSRRPKHNHVPPKPLVVISDYSKMSDTEPHQVWYPAMSGTYENETFEKTYQSLSK